MIEKFTKDEIESAWEEPLAGNVQSIYGKINEIIDAVNELGKDVCFLHRKVVELGYKEPESRSENVQPDAESRSENVQGWGGFKTISPEQMGYIKLDSDSLAKFLKIHPQYNKNGMLNLSSCSVRLQNELERTRGALNIAIKTLKFIEQQGNCIDVEDEAFDCLEMIKSSGVEL